MAGLIMLADTAGVLRPVRQATSTVIAPTQQWTFQFATNLSRFGDFFADNETLRRENAQLRQDLATARAEQFKVADLSRRIDELERQLAFSKNAENKRFDTVNATVVSRETNTSFDSIVINRGANLGVTKGMTVLDLSGYLVGKVAKVENEQSVVLLITDVNMGVKVTTERYSPEQQRLPIEPPVEATTVGLNLPGAPHKLKMGRVPPAADLKEGDLVFSSGLGNTFPGQLLLGRVEKVIYQDGQPEKEAMIQPAADLERLQQVILIIATKS